ncbi:NlpC/P60 family protein [Jiella marina]|uniref:NlpC/P60 family protein n=1 Tax=Jiella sp. LLJ827 TaxID=2917712 RepID=UPI0021009E47|nr:NlpC/P60 family protein [Jiella sp. LLJ827]MCQ0989599.1 NlpC/P60 family protein [Jiella sp. LLJ827]
MRDDVGTRVLLAARAFLGTPYRHQGSTRGIGCDCLGLIRGVWRELYGCEPETPGAYAVTWSLRSGADRLTEAAERHLHRIDLADALPGDVLLFRWRRGAPATHCAILDEGERIIHAYQGAAVVSSAFPKAWRARLSGSFRFPE